MPVNKTPVEEYIERQPEEFQNMLTEMRVQIRTLVPDAEEVFSYQVGCFKHHYMLVGIGVTKNSCSLYTMSPKLVKEMKARLKSEGVKVSGATLHFNPDEPLPVEIIEEIVKKRIQENLDRKNARK